VRQGGVVLRQKGGKTGGGVSVDFNGGGPQGCSDKGFGK